MNDAEQRAVRRVLDCLFDLNRDQVDTAEAQRRVARVAQAIPELGLDLVWEEQALSSTIHYDALLRLPGRGTLSLSVAPEAELPWPLRGVHHAREYELLSVNGRVLTIEDAMAACDAIWDEARIAGRLVDMCLIDEALDAERLSVSEVELQAALDAFRSARELHTVASTERWLAAHGMTEEALEAQLGAELARKALREKVTAASVDAYFAEHATDFDLAQIARFEVEHLETAERLCAQIRSGALDYFAAASERFVVDEQTHGKFLLRVRRGGLAPEQAEPIFGASAGQTVGPMPSGERFAIVRVLAQQRAVLDAATREHVAEVLFDRWLLQRRERAQIEWFWGRAR
jgi:putative peptide maturation system protein